MERRTQQLSSPIAFDCVADLHCDITYNGDPRRSTHLFCENSAAYVGTFYSEESGAEICALRCGKEKIELSDPDLNLCVSLYEYQFAIIDI